MLREHNDGTHKQYLKCYKEIGGHASDDGEINDRLFFQYSENLITIDGVDAKSGAQVVLHIQSKPQELLGKRLLAVVGGTNHKRW